MARKVSIATLIILVVAGALAASGYWIVKRRSETVCGFCQRHITPQAAVVAEVGGKRRYVCCAHCAVTEGLQEHKPVRLVQVTDYRSGRKLAPENASYVEGSRAVVCRHDMAHLDEMKRGEAPAFDRCAPGTIAFATRAEAEAFVSANGGEVRSLGEVLAPVLAQERAK